MQKDADLSSAVVTRERPPADPQSPIAERVRMKAQTVCLFGNFGTENLGNERTLETIIQNLRKYLPDAKVTCICPDPEDTSARHGIAAFPMSYRYSRTFLTRSSGDRRNPVIRLIRQLVIRMPRELVEWFKAARTLKGASMLVMTGTGMLGDFGISPLGLHYEILKWSIIAKIRGCKLLFVSVGVGPIDHPLSRRIVKSSLSLADYRSYRDGFSQQYLTRIGFDASKDPVYPDLVFSFLDQDVQASRHQHRAQRVVGLGLMEYYGKRSNPTLGQQIYRHYIDQIASFAAWLLEQGYSVRLLIGDLAYDQRAIRDVLRTLEEKGTIVKAGQILAEPVACVEQLFEQIARTDVVVATRFHNIVFALMLDKPVVALSYHVKVRSLMADTGLADYCQDIEQLDLPRLKEQFIDLEKNAGSLKSVIREKTEEYRAALELQYRRIFKDL